MTRQIAVSELKSKLLRAYKTRDDTLFDACLDSLPSIPACALCYIQDGNQRCCVFGDFRNLQVDPSGFGDTDDDAYRDLIRNFESGKKDCDVCSGSGLVTTENPVTVDSGTKWQRTAIEHVSAECPHCDGTGVGKQ